MLPKPREARGRGWRPGDLRDRQYAVALDLPSGPAPTGEDWPAFLLTQRHAGNLDGSFAPLRGSDAGLKTGAPMPR